MDPTNSDTEFNFLIHNLQFVDWVINPTPESDLFWQKYIAEHQAERKEIEKAVYVIRKIVPREKKLARQEIDSLWNRIEDEFNESRQIGRSRLYPWIAAASIVMLLGVSGVFYFSFNRAGETSVNYQALTKVETQDNEVKLILSDKSEELLNSKSPDVKYDSAGQLIVDSDKRIEQKKATGNSENDLNQLIVPRGRRTSLTLSDGTRLWLNSGSRVIFPVVFTGKKREIFLEGEAYLEVARDASKPFHVVTNKVNISVLGTSFDVTAYPDDESESVVLVEGSVRATIDSKKTVMKPNQLLTYYKNTGQTVLDETDVQPYISWKDGWLYAQKETLGTLAIKLSRYYNVKIEFGDEQAKQITLSGKVDLKSECSEIFRALSSTAPITYSIENDKIFILSKPTE